MGQSMHTCILSIRGKIFLEYLAYICILCILYGKYESTTMELGIAFFTPFKILPLPITLLLLGFF